MEFVEWSFFFASPSGVGFLILLIAFVFSRQPALWTIAVVSSLILEVVTWWVIRPAMDVPALQEIPEAILRAGIFTTTGLALVKFFWVAAHHSQRPLVSQTRYNY